VNLLKTATFDRKKTENVSA